MRHLWTAITKVLKKLCHCLDHYQVSHRAIESKNVARAERVTAHPIWTARKLHRKSYGEERSNRAKGHVNSESGRILRISRRSIFSSPWNETRPAGRFLLASKWGSRKRSSDRWTYRTPGGRECVFASRDACATLTFICENFNVIYVLQCASPYGYRRMRNNVHGTRDRSAREPVSLWKFVGRENKNFIVPAILNCVPGFVSTSTLSLLWLMGGIKSGDKVTFADRSLWAVRQVGRTNRR